MLLLLARMKLNFNFLLLLILTTILVSENAKFDVIPLAPLVVHDELAKEWHRVGVIDLGQVVHEVSPQKSIQAEVKTQG